MGGEAGCTVAEEGGEAECTVAEDGGGRQGVLWPRMGGGGGGGVYRG